MENKLLSQVVNREGTELYLWKAHHAVTGIPQYTGSPQQARPCRTQALHAPRPSVPGPRPSAPRPSAPGPSAPGPFLPCASSSCSLPPHTGRAGGWRSPITPAPGLPASPWPSTTWRGADVPGRLSLPRPVCSSPDCSPPPPGCSLGPLPAVQRSACVAGTRAWHLGFFQAEQGRQSRGAQSRSELSRPHNKTTLRPRLGFCDTVEKSQQPEEGEGPAPAMWAQAWELQNLTKSPPHQSGFTQHCQGPGALC